MTSIVRNIAVSSSLLAICLAIYMIPALLSIVLLVDEKAFYWFNGSLDIGYSWQLLWFYMNHNYEKNLNLVVFVLINVFATRAALKLVSGMKTFCAEIPKKVISRKRAENIVFMLV